MLALFYYKFPDAIYYPNLMFVLQVGASSWWKRLACGVWTFVSYNLWLFAIWLLVLGTYRWPVLRLVSDQLLVLVRSLALSDLGTSLRTDCLLLAKHPFLFLATFLTFAFFTKRFFSSSVVDVSIRNYLCVSHQGFESVELGIIIYLEHKDENFH